MMIHGICINHEINILVENNINFYFTFTNISESEELDRFKNELRMRYGNAILNDYFCIPLIKYDAIS